MPHYLKIMMDAVMGRRNFRNEIVWKRTSSHNDSKGFGRITDYLLFYGPAMHGDSVRVPLNPEHVTKFYRHKDERGAYGADSLSAKGLSGGGYHYDFHGKSGPWRYPEQRMLELEPDGRIHLPLKKTGTPRLKRYLHENKGRIPPCIWDDISPVQGSSKEKIGYPTQKPLALLDRIIKASSNPGEVVFDPFCGCATTLVAADRLERQWVGIDISELAVKLVRGRIEKDQGMFPDLVARTDRPNRDDLGDLLAYNSLAIKNALYGEQGGDCNGCGTHFQKQHLTVDHIIAQAKGGTDHIENLQLLRGHCNSVKGDRGQEYLLVKLAA